MTRVLLVDEDLQLRELLRASLALSGIDVLTVADAASALAALETAEFDCVISEMNLAQLDGFRLCERIVATWPHTPVVIMTGMPSVESATLAIRARAFDYLTKPIHLDAIIGSIGRAAAYREARDAAHRLSAVTDAGDSFDELVGDSPQMQHLFRLLRRVSDAEVPVLITGESGTGKELVARALHRRSRRAAHPMVSINCAAVPEHLIESELFGHVRGAFTDAKTARDGLFLKASGSTLFLDEIGELPIAMQAKLLRALQEQVIRPVGSDEDIVIDVRLITATNRDLEAAVEERQFREDLFYRINVVQVSLPPLRSRGQDVLLLAQRFIEQSAIKQRKQINGLSRASAERMLAYDWPGNVRELQNCIERAVALTQFDEVSLEDLPERLQLLRIQPLVSDELLTLDEVERRHIAHVMTSVAGNKLKAARALGLDRKTLYRKLERYSLDRPAKGGAQKVVTASRLGKVLIIDDDRKMRTIGRVSLESVGQCTVLLAGSGQEGIEMALGEQPDLILLDVMMPGQDGLETLAKLRADPRTAGTPVVLFTARINPREVDDYYARGAAGVISKPFDPMTLPEQLKTIFADTVR